MYFAEKDATRKRMVLKVLHQVPDLFTLLIGAFDRFLQEYEIIAGI